MTVLVAGRTDLSIVLQDGKKSSEPSNELFRATHCTHIAGEN